MPIVHSVGAQAWCLLILLSFVGWGYGALKLLAGRVPSIGVAACLGTTVAIFAGGLLNLLQLITVPVLLLFMAVGLVIGALAARGAVDAPAEIRIRRQLWHEAWPSKWIALFCLVFVILFRFVSSTHAWQYLPQDDENFYLVAPQKMMQTHHYAADPFSERRIESSLGASYFLQAFALVCLPIENVQMVDRGIGFLMLLLLILTLAEKFGLSPPETVIIGLLATVLTPIDFNVTFAILPSALVLTMVLVAMQPELFTRRPHAQALIIGVTAGALVALKTTFLPFTGIFCLVLCPRMATGRGWRAAFTGWSVALIGALVVLVPWMVAQRMTSGTFLYPVFGSGYDFSAYKQFPMPFHAEPLKILLKGATFYVPLSGIIFAQLFLLRQARSTILLVTTVAALLSSLATGFGTGGDDSQRYNYALVTPTFLLSFFQFSQEIRLNPQGRLAPLLRGCTVFVLVGYIGLHAIRGQYGSMWHEVQTCFTGRRNSSAETRREYRDIVAAFPADGRVLTTVQGAYLMSPLDERILLCDFPGCAGPPPGWPVHENGEALARYLLGHSVRYLAYSYKGNTQLDYCLNTDLTKMSVRSQVQYGTYLLADKQYRELWQTRKVLYDDGKVFIIDLATPRDHSS